MQIQGSFVYLSMCCIYTPALLLTYNTEFLTVIRTISYIFVLHRSC